MSARYVPPGRRPRPEDTVVKRTPAEDAFLVSADEVRAHFWPATQDELPRLSSAGAGHRTLNDSAEDPSKLAYIVLFHDANPQWEPDNIIFTKSNLQFLPAQLADDPSKAPLSTEDKDLADSSALKVTGEDVQVSKIAVGGTDGEAKLAKDGGKGTAYGSDDPKCARKPIAVFKCVRNVSAGRYLRFDGYFQIDKLAFLDPKSPELIKMLQKKWTKTDRFGNARPLERSEEQWKESLSHRWAVLKLKRDDVAEEELGAPKVERLPDPDPKGPDVPKKSVNEMLAEMRMADQK